MEKVSLLNFFFVQSLRKGRKKSYVSTNAVIIHCKGMPKVKFDLISDILIRAKTKGILLLPKISTNKEI